MTGNWVLAHLFSITHGLAAALISVAAFYAAGRVLFPQRLQASMRWPDNVSSGLTLFVVLCWIATSSRHIRVIYVCLLFAAGLWGLGSLRFRGLQASLAAPHRNPAVREWVATFALFYVFAYLMISPPAGAAGLPLPSDGAISLVTYARYARHLMAYGTASIDLASFDYLHSPAGAYLLAWHSLLFLGDPLDAAMPLLFMVAALFGAVAVDLARTAFGLSWRGAMAIAAIALCAPMFRWALATYSLGELLAATSVLYLASVAGRAAIARSLDAFIFLGAACGCVLLFFSAWSAALSIWSMWHGVVDTARYFSPVALVGLPRGTPSAAKTPDSVSAALMIVLPLVPLLWAGAARGLRGASIPDRVRVPAADRNLASALVRYIAVGVIVGNVAVQIVRAPAPKNWSGAWRQLGEAGRLPFRGLTLKVADQPNGLSTALAMYYMPGRNPRVIGRGVALDQLPFEDVSRQEPLFIQNFGCEGVGHADTVSAPGVGCLLMAPPSIAVGASYPFNRTYLFFEFDRMSTRDPGGRWNSEPSVNFRITADPQRERLDRDTYINFRVNPFLPAAAPPLRLLVRWGRDRSGEVSVGAERWFSLPIGTNDWSGNRLWTVPVAIEFPNGRTLLFQEFALTEAPRGEP